VATDGELLMQFVRQRDHGAFAQIVERHGRLVWMICRQVLRHYQDVEDAFQATFLILAERAQTIRASDSASAWLFGVAQRTALAARRKRERRREEALATDPPVVEESLRVIDKREMLYVLMQEIQSLPARYQTPLVMRYLEGQSRRAIAEQTDSTVGQIQGRLVRGRRLLRSRFLRRGVSLSLAAGAAAGTAASAEAAVTPALVDSTAETCLKVKSSGTVSGLSPAVLALVHEGVKAMWMTFVAKCTAIVSAAVLAGGIVWAAQGSGTAPSGGEGGTAQIELQGNGSAEAENEQGKERGAFIAGRFKYKIPFEIGSTEFKEGGRIEIEEVWGTRPRIEVGGQYIVRGKYVLPHGERGKLYFYETANGEWGRTPTADMDLQAVDLDKETGEFQLVHGMAGPGNFHLYLASPDKYSRYFANVYFGTGDNVWRKKDSTATAGATSVAAGHPATATAGSSQPAKSVERDREAAKVTLQKQYGDLLAEMNQRLDEKAIESAELEMQQLQKSLLQRKLEHLHAMLVEIESPTASPSDEKAAKEKEQNRSKLDDEVTRNMEQTRTELAKQTAKTAKLSADLERLQLAVARIQRRLDELNRRSTQLEFPQEQPPAPTGPAVAVPAAGATPYSLIQDPLAAQQLEELRRDVGKLQAENAELKKQLDLHHSTPPAKDHDASGKILRPGDQIVVTTILGSDRKDKTQKGRDARKVMTIGDDGKIDFQEGVGRIDIAGMDESQASVTIRNALGQSRAWGVFRIERVDGASGDTTQLFPQPVNEAHLWQQALTNEFDKLHSELEKLQTENASLKKELEQYSKPIGRSR
jgi:RNA polymerase sigma factor (sigma-70 family)